MRPAFARERCDPSSGFSLPEVLVALALLTVGVAAAAGLTGVATRANASARSATVATLLALEKMEQLRSLTWSVDALGEPISDTTTGLDASPSDALDRNAPGYFDLLDASGRSLGSGPPPPEARFVRRWSILPSPAAPDQTLILQVRITRTEAPDGPDEARLVTARTRKAVR